MVVNEPIKTIGITLRRQIGDVIEAPLPPPMPELLAKLEQQSRVRKLAQSRR